MPGSEPEIVGGDEADSQVESQAPTPERQANPFLEGVANPELEPQGPTVDLETGVGEPLDPRGQEHRGSYDDIMPEDSPEEPAEFSDADPAADEEPEGGYPMNGG